MSITNLQQTDPRWEKIRSNLAEFLHREPTDAEIINAQADVVIMGQVRDQEAAEQVANTTAQVEALQTRQSMSI